MSDISENENYTQTGEESVEEFTTVFSDPKAHDDSKKHSGKRVRILAVTAAVLAVAILVTSTVAIIKLIPKKEDENNGDNNPFEEISVLSADSSKFSAVTVNNSNGEFRFVNTPADNEDDSEQASVWSFEGLDNSLTSDSMISSIVSSASSVTATRKIDTKTDAECGLESPKCSVSVSYSDQDEGYTLSIGDASPDKTGIYLKSSRDNSIYIVDESYVSEFEFNILDLADTTSFSPAEFEGDISTYSDNSGNLVSFDKLTLSGKNFEQSVVIEPNRNKNLSSVIAFLVTSPQNRYGANIDKALTLFSNGLTVSGAYSYDVSPESLKSVGLDDPDVIVSIEILGQKKTYKISVIDSEYCAVINDESFMIRKVSVANLVVAGYHPEDMYASWVSMEVINDLSNFTFASGETEYSFDIKYDADAEDNKYEISCNGKKMTASNFQSFYSFFVGMKCSDYKTEQLSSKPSATVTLTFALDGSKRVISYTKVSETKYQYSIDGVPMGKIPATSYNKLIKNIKLAAQNKEIK